MKKIFFLLLALWCGGSVASGGPAAPVVLTVKSESITVNGKPSTVFSIVQPNGQPGLTVDQKDGFHVIVKNDLPVPTSIHWHGLVLPNLQDGVPYLTQDPIPPGGQKEYKFPLLQHGTYWMHSHYGLQEQVLASAPLIILNDEERRAADSQVVMFLSDFTFRSPGEILETLRKPPEESAADKSEGMAAMKASIPALVQAWDGTVFSSTMESRPMVDIDVAYDALLANRRTLADPEIVSVTEDKTVLLRIIAGSSATNFFIDTGALEAELLAVDGQPVTPLRGTFFQLGVAQRIDLRVKIPQAGGAFPILALGEGTDLQTGLILATKGATIPQLPSRAGQMAGALDNTQELQLRATRPLASKPVTRPLASLLGGAMSGYTWSINGKSYPNRDTLNVASGDRVEMTIKNDNMMSHPMHLHGHDFQVTEIDGTPVSGALRDTILVPPHGTTKIQFDANNPGLWAYHCHILYHLATGMFTVIKYDGADEKFWQPEKTALELDEKLP